MIVDLARNDLGRVARLRHGRGRAALRARVASRRAPPRLERRGARCGPDVSVAGHRARHVPARIGHRRAQDPRARDHRGARAGPARALLRRDRLLRARGRHRPVGRDPHLRGGAAGACTSMSAAPSWPTRTRRSSGARRCTRRRACWRRPGRLGAAEREQRRARLLKVWLDGALVDEEAACVSAFDHGFLLGDGVFETLRVYARRAVRARRAPGAAARERRGRCESRCRRSTSKRPCTRCCEANELERGAHADHAHERRRTGRPRTRRPARRPSLVVALPLTPWPPTSTAIVSRLRRDEHSPLAGVKTTSLADERGRARGGARRGRGRGAAAEHRTATSARPRPRTCSWCATASRRRRRSTSGCLAGITRAHVLELGRGRANAVPRATCVQADEAFLPRRRARSSRWSRSTAARSEPGAAARSPCGWRTPIREMVAARLGRRQRSRLRPSSSSSRSRLASAPRCSTAVMPTASAPSQFSRRSSTNTHSAGCEPDPLGAEPEDLRLRLVEPDLAGDHDAVEQLGEAVAVVAPAAPRVGDQPGLQAGGARAAQRLDHAPPRAASPRTAGRPDPRSGPPARR